MVGRLRRHAGYEVQRELKAKAVRLVREHSGDHPSEWAAIGAVAQRLGIGSSETLRKWLRQAEVDGGARQGTTTAEAAEIRALRRKVAELERTLEILTEATRFSPREADPLRR
jgi:transposase